MKRNEQEMDKLTRSLMQDATEQPSADLNSRIMAMIRKSAQARKVFAMNKPVSVGQLVGVLAVYLLVIIGGAALLQNQLSDVSQAVGFLKDYFPLILTVGGGISFFIFFGYLDSYLYRRGHASSDKTNSDAGN